MRPAVVPTAIRTRAILAVASIGGLAAFAWPLLVEPGSMLGAHVSDAPLVFIAVVPVIVAVVLAEMSSGGIDSKAVAMLGILSALGAALRPLGAGLGGVETVFLPLILGGRVFGPGFGFVLGSTTLFASALLTAGVGPWLPFQMLAASWVGMGAGLLPRMRGRAEIAVLAAYGAISAIGFGMLMNLWSWPFALGVGTEASFVPGDPVLSNLQRLVAFAVATSLGWDLGRAITNVVLIVVVGAGVLGALRRAHRRFAFDSTGRFAPPGASVGGIGQGALPMAVHIGGVPVGGVVDKHPLAHGVEQTGSVGLEEVLRRQHRPGRA
ncbi:MAG: ECF transporter S component [Actinomycetota bacterium]|nr:ECF transporter S component [Actinomycetota bacterium]